MFPFCSRNTEYKKPFGAVKTGEEVQIDFPVSKDIIAKGVSLVLRNDDEYNHKVILKQTKTTDKYNVFSGNFSLQIAGVYYYRFEVETDDGIMFIGRDDGGFAVRGDWLPEWQLTVYYDDYRTPDTLKNGIIYHIFVDRFNRVEDGKKPKYGYLKSPRDDVVICDKDGVYRANDFYGGNFKGIIEKLDYLQELSVSALYLSPIFESSSNHRYDTGDYSRIDALIGDEDGFKSLCEQCKKRGVSVILDGVFNHTGSDSKYFNKSGHYDSVGAYQSKNSPYYDWYTFDNYPDSYICWWGISVVPTISENAKSFQNYIAGDGGILEKWAKLGASAWRLDVVDELSRSFVEKIRLKLKSMGDITLIGEVWEDASNKESYGIKRRYFLGDELDGVMNYPFKEAIIKYLNDCDAKAFCNSINTIIENYPKQSLDCCMTLLGTHDTIRIINALSGAIIPESKLERLNYKLTDDERELGKKKLKLASVIQYMLPGLPTIYYGDEQGLEGFEDPINRRLMNFNLDKDLLSHYVMLGKLRKEYISEFLNLAKISSKGNRICIQRGKIKATINPEKLTYDIEFCK